jgi:two-component system, OmpR family, sensor kinase
MATEEEARAGLVHTPDDFLLRRFGWVRAVGGGAYIVAVVVLFFIFGWRVWPLVLGVPVLAVVTTGYFIKSPEYPRTSVIVSLVADAVVLGGAVSYLGGTGSGLVMLYAIVVVSAGILLGPSSAFGFAGFVIVLSGVQLLLEEVGLEPALLHRPELQDRVAILLASVAGLASIGYLSGVYSGRLHELIAVAGEEAEVVRRKQARRRDFMHHAWVGVRPPLRDVEEVADALSEGSGELTEQARRRLASRLRMSTSQLQAEIDQLVDMGVMDEPESRRPEPLLLRRFVEDCLVALGQRLEPYQVECDLPPLKVLGDRRAARRVVYNLLENLVEHTPPGTRAHLAAVTTRGHGVLVLTDDGPGIPPAVADRIFDPPQGDAGEDKPAVGLPLVRELCEAMGAECRYERAPSGGARFMVAFKLAPTSAPSADDD